MGIDGSRAEKMVEKELLYGKPSTISEKEREEFRRKRLSVLEDEGRQLIFKVKDPDIKTFIFNLTRYAIKIGKNEGVHLNFIHELFKVALNIKVLTEMLKEENISQFKYSDKDLIFYNILKDQQERSPRMGWAKRACVIGAYRAYRAGRAGFFHEGIFDTQTIVSDFLGTKKGIDEKMLVRQFVAQQIQSNSHSFATQCRDLHQALENEFKIYESKTQSKGNRKKSIQQVRNKIAEQQESKEDAKTKLHELIAFVKGHINATTKDHHDLQGWNLFARKDSRLANAYRNALKVIGIFDVEKIKAAVVSFDMPLNAPNTVVMRSN
jgi:hypothetical protein